MSPAEKLRFESDNEAAGHHENGPSKDRERRGGSCRMKSAKVRRRTSTSTAKFVVEERQRRPLQFNDEFFKSSVGHTIVFRELEQLIPAETDWYDGGYRANIVTFTIAKLAQNDC